MKMKKWICTLLTAAMLTGVLTGCGSGTDTQNTEQAASESQEAEAAVTAEETEEAATDTEEEAAKAEGTTADGAKKVLVAYYSATGSTAAVAQTIADTSGADLFEITPVTPYTSDDLDWTDDNSRVSREHQDESLRDVELTQATPDNWDEYDTVLIGYPIWWGIAAWPVDNFVKNNDFTGKTVIPFCTSASSGLANSGQLLSEMAGTGDWQEGERFSSAAKDTDVKDWVAALDIAR